MTRNDYELIAKMFKARIESDVAKNLDSRYALEVLAEDFCNIAVCQNSRFKRETFLTACGLAD